jgi:beta-glucosidase
LLASDLAIDVSGEAAGGIELAVEMNVLEAGAGEISVGAVCSEGCEGFVPLTDAFNAAAGTGWRRLRISLVCFQDAGADLAAVTAPFAVRTDGPLTLAISDVRLVQDADGARDCGVVDE